MVRYPSRYNSNCPRSTRTTKIRPEKVGNSDYIQNYTPPPPPPGKEEGWELQFCKWWGWNWVKKDNFEITKYETKTCECAAALRSSSPTQPPKKSERNCLKDLCSCLFSRPKASTSLQKLYSTPSNSVCYQETCTFLKEREPLESFSCLELQGNFSDTVCKCVKKTREKQNRSTQKCQECKCCKNCGCTQGKDEVSSSSSSQDHCPGCPKRKQPEKPSCKCCKDCKCSELNKNDAQNGQIKSNNNNNNNMVCACTQVHSKTPGIKCYCEGAKCKQGQYVHLVCHCCHCCGYCKKKNEKTSEQVDVPPEDTLSKSGKDSSKERKLSSKSQRRKFSPTLSNNPEENKSAVKVCAGCQSRKVLATNEVQTLSCDNKEIQTQSKKLIPLETEDTKDVKERYTEAYSYHVTTHDEGCQHIPSNNDKQTSLSKPTDYPETIFCKDYPHYRSCHRRSLSIDHREQISNQEPPLNQKTHNKDYPSYQNMNKKLPYLENVACQESKFIINEIPYQKFSACEQCAFCCINRIHKDCMHRPEKELSSQENIKLLSNLDVNCRNGFNNANLPVKKTRISQNPINSEDPSSKYPGPYPYLSSKKNVSKFGVSSQTYPWLKATQSEILQYNTNLGEQFYSPLSGKIYNLSTKSPPFLDDFVSTTLPDPIEVEEDLKYLENLEEKVKTELNSRVMLDAVCDAILFKNNCKAFETDSTILSRFSLSQDSERKPLNVNGNTNIKKEESDTGSLDVIDSNIFNKFNPELPLKFENHFMEKVEELVKKIMKNEETKQKSDTKSKNDIHNKIATRYPKRSGSPVTTEMVKRCKLGEDPVYPSSEESIGVQVSNFNNLFEKMDEIAMKSKVNVAKIQGVIRSLPIPSSTLNRRITFQDDTLKSKIVTENSSSKTNNSEIMEKLHEAVMDSSVDEKVVKNMFDIISNRTTEAKDALEPIPGFKKGSDLSLKTISETGEFVQTEHFENSSENWSSLSSHSITRETDNNNEIPQSSQLSDSNEKKNGSIPKKRVSRSMIPIKKSRIT